MNQTELQATQSGQLAKSKRIITSIRMTVKDHAELKEIAELEQRSMSFVTLRRYLKGRDVELAEQNQ